MFGVEVVSEPYISIQYNVLDDILYAYWKGNLDKESIMDGCEKELFYLKKFQCKKVLTDNTHVTSIWDDAVEWISYDWFPRFHLAGCLYFAVVYSPDQYSRLSTDKVIKLGTGGTLVTTFDDIDVALRWLKQMG